jgi:flagellar hook-basal body complex protein FliE
MIDIASALRAYSAAPRPDAALGIAEEKPANSFASVLGKTIEDTVATTRQGEKAMVDGATGKAELTDVVTAIANAEVTLETIVALRDRVITAYQEIMRMPI